jgi:restriction alleviation protein Lar
MQGAQDIEVRARGVAMNELKACAFCGTEPVGPAHGDSGWWIECERCEIVMDRDSKKELVKQWNNRATIRGQSTMNLCCVNTAERVREDYEKRINELEKELKTCHNESIEIIHDQGARIDELEDKTSKVSDWCDAYPLKVFPEPDFKKAREALKDKGMTLDSISASNMRHVLNGIKRIIG